jgi:hypothetical protein
MDTTLASRASERLSDSATTRAIAWLTAWDSQGVHRTATVGDEAGAHWLIREAAGLRAAPAVETFALDRLDPIDAYLEFDGTRVPGVPVFDAPATGADGVVGILGPVGAATPIAVAELSPQGIYTPDYEELRCNAVHRGLVIVCKGARPGLGLLNAERFRHPSAWSRRSAALSHSIARRSSPLTYKMFDVGFVRELLGLPNPSAAKIPASLPKPERNPLIGDLSEYELAKLEHDRLFWSRKSQKESGGRATTVGVGTGGSNPASSSGESISAECRGRALAKG